MENVTPSLSEAKEYIYNLDFSNTLNKMRTQLGWLKKDALQVCEMYRNFLYLNKKYGTQHKLPPSEDIDEFWHLHILDTKKYRQDCQAIFGYYFDHYPYFGIDEKTTYEDLEKAFATTQHLYYQEFNGQYIYQVRGAISKLVGSIKMLTMKTLPKRYKIASI